MIRSGFEMLTTSALLMILGLAFILFGLAWALYNLPVRLLRWKSR